MTFTTFMPVTNLYIRSQKHRNVKLGTKNDENTSNNVKTSTYHVVKIWKAAQAHLEGRDARARLSERQIDHFCPQNDPTSGYLDCT